MSVLKPALVLSVLLSAIFTHNLCAQVVDPWKQPDKRKQASWQQEVDHTIKVKLIPKTHTLEAEEVIKYTNNSTTTLTEIWFHVWPNAFSNNKTAFGKEALITGNARYLYATDDERGSVTGLNFKVNDQPAEYTYHPQYEDILKLKLPFSLAPGQTITISTPFIVKLPHHFSRMGVNGKLVSATQWYPKPAVFDANGWNIFPYQDQGEYYSEYGAYKVTITLPANYKVAATGALQDESEKEWLRSLNRRLVKEEDLKDNRDSTENKTITYVQDHVPDFAWFASPYFQVYMDSVTLKKDRIVETLAMFEPKKPGRFRGVRIGGGNSLPESGAKQGREMLQLIEKALTYYSKRVGTYPYDYCSVVIGGLPSAGGMEYPMVTICASKDAIVHEVGHNWFQNILGSQERAFPWMDESINTFYHTQAEESVKEWLPGTDASPNSMITQWHITQDFGICQPGNMHSSDFQSVAYGTVVYAGNPIHFDYLQEYLGKPLMDSCMKAYFEKWKFRHPLPLDIKEVFEQVSKKDLDWFFDGLLNGQLPDYRISKVKRSGDEGVKVGVKNQRSLQVPLKLSYIGPKKSQHVWLDGNDTAVFIKQKGVQKIALNPTGFLLERNLANNQAETRGILKRWGKIDLKYVLYRRGSNNLWFVPLIFTSNSYDGYTPGIMFSNFSIPRRNYEWFVIPSYGVKSKTVVGIANLQRNIYLDKGPFSMLQAGLYVQRYSMATEFQGFRNTTPYNHFSPFLHGVFKRNKRAVSSSLTLAADINRLDRVNFNTLPQDLFNYDSSNTWKHSSDYENQFLRLKYRRKIMKKMAPAELKAMLEVGGNKASDRMHFAKLSVSHDWFIPYLGKYTTQKLRTRSKSGKFGAYLKVYGGAFLWKNNVNKTDGLYNFVANGAQGNYDYAFRDVISRRDAIAPNRPTGISIGNQQMLMDVNSVRMFLFTGTPGNVSTASLTSNSWQLGFTAQSSLLPIIPNLQWFFDGVSIPVTTITSNGSTTTSKTNAEFYWASGLTYRLHSAGFTTFELNLPLLYSDYFKNNVKSNDVKVKQMISWKMSWSIFSIDKSYEQAVL